MPAGLPLFEGWSNMTHVRQSRPGSDLAFEVNMLRKIKLFSLRAEEFGDCSDPTGLTPDRAPPLQGYLAHKKPHSPLGPL